MDKIFGQIVINPLSPDDHPLKHSCGYPVENGQGTPRKIVDNIIQDRNFKKK